jgi:hypothetical protein
MASVLQDRSSFDSPPIVHLQRDVQEYDAQTDHLDGHDAKVSFRLIGGCFVFACDCAYLTVTRFLTIAASHPFVMNSILAFSASHLAWISQSSETRNLAFHHAGVALKGLHEGIASFTKANSDAVLASSLLLAWQATEW